MYFFNGFRLIVDKKGMYIRKVRGLMWKFWYINVLLGLNLFVLLDEIVILYLLIKEKEELLFFKYNYNCKFWMVV